MFTVNAIVFNKLYDNVIFCLDDHLENDKSIVKIIISEENQIQIAIRCIPPPPSEFTFNQ